MIGILRKGGGCVYISVVIFVENIKNLVVKCWFDVVEFVYESVFDLVYNYFIVNYDKKGR